MENANLKTENENLKTENENLKTENENLKTIFRKYRAQLQSLTASCKQLLFKVQLRSQITGEPGEPNVIIPQEQDKSQPSSSVDLGIVIKDSAKELNQFYTVPQLAQECVDKFIEKIPEMWNNQRTWYLEPSAGEGDILKLLPAERRVGIDLEPKDLTHEVKEQDFFTTNRELLKIPKDAPLVLIGNPPFGRFPRGFDHSRYENKYEKLTMSLAFFKHATEELNADYIAWILPNTFLTRKTREKIHKNYHLIYVMNITCCYVHKGKLLNLPTMFGIWKKSEISVIQRPIIIKSSPDFNIIGGPGSKEVKLSIYENEKKGNVPTNTYIWMRKIMKQKERRWVPPVYLTGAAVEKSYKDVRMKTSSQAKILEATLIEVTSPELYEKVLKHFSEFKWQEEIGQFMSLRTSSDDARPPRPVHISSTYIYAAYNNDEVFKPYREYLEPENAAAAIHKFPIMEKGRHLIDSQIYTGSKPIEREASQIKRSDIKGGRKTRSKKRRKKKKRTRRKNRKKLNPFKK